MNPDFNIHDLAGDDGEFLDPPPPKKKRKRKPKPTPKPPRVTLWVAEGVLLLCIIIVIVAILGYRHPPQPASAPAEPLWTPIPLDPAVFASQPALLTNSSLDQNDFGLIKDWTDTRVFLNQWYLVQQVPPGQPDARWVEWVDLSQENRGYGLKSTDQQDCDVFCSTEAIQLVAAEENTTYYLMADVRVEEGSSPTLYLDFLDANRQRIDVFTSSASGNQWSRITIIARSPTGTRFIRVILYTSNKAKTVVYWDNIDLRSYGSASP
jgi:hypothetical protein